MIEGSLGILVILGLICAVAIIGLLVWFLVRFIGLLDNVRYLADVAQAENPKVPYRQTNSIVTILVIIAVVFPSFITLGVFIFNITSIFALGGALDTALDPSATVN